MIGANEQTETFDRLHKLWSQCAAGKVSIKDYLYRAPELASSHFDASTLPPDVLERLTPLQKAVQVNRDRYGVPLLVADNQNQLFADFGAALAQDRLFQMEMIRRACTGRVAEVLGPNYSEFDKKILRMYDPASIDAQYRQLGPAEEELLSSYTYGINLWVIACTADKTLRPTEYNHFGFEPDVWSNTDILKIFTIALMHRFANVCTQAEELDFLNYLIGTKGFDYPTAWDIFNQTNWMDDPNAPTTIDPTGAPRKSQEAGPMPKLPAAPTDLPLSTYIPIDSKGQYVNITNRQKQETHRREQIGTYGPAGSGIYPDASNMWIVRREKTDENQSILLNGPQFGWINPAYMWDVHAYCPEMQFSGSAYYGVPTLICGNNGTVGWGATSGRSSCVDLYIETLKSDDPHQYLFKGTYHEMVVRNETIRVKGQHPEPLTIYSTGHGIVEEFSADGKTAYSRKLSWTGQEVDTFFGYIDSMKATSYMTWLEQAKRITMSLNWYYFDKDGNIGYVHVGKYPVRPDNQDPRLPANGDGSMEWKGFVPFENQPQALNPASNFIPNWNNRPSKSWPNSGNWPRIWGAADRVRVLIDVLGAEGPLSHQDIIDLNAEASEIDLPLQFFLPFFKRAAALPSAGDLVKQMVGRLEVWDGLWTNTRKPSRYDGPEPAIMQATLTYLLELVLKDTVGDYFFRYQATGYPIHAEYDSADIPAGLRIVYNALLGKASGVPQSHDFLKGKSPEEVVLAALRKAEAALVAAHGANIDDWFQPAYPLSFVPFNHLGIPQALPDRAPTSPLQLNRGTQNDIITEDGTSLDARNVSPPGQNGTVTGTGGTAGRHATDQLPLFRDFQYKKLPSLPPS